MSLKKVNSNDVLRLPAFSHAIVAGDFIYVSGTLGTEGKEMQLAAGGTAGQTRQTLLNIKTILNEAGAGLEDVVKMNVFLKDETTFADMNKVYVEIMGEDGPARITVSNAKLGLDAEVEIDCIAYKPGT